MLRWGCSLSESGLACEFESLAPFMCQVSGRARCAVGLYLAHSELEPQLGRAAKVQTRQTNKQARPKKVDPPRPPPRTEQANIRPVRCKRHVRQQLNQTLCAGQRSVQSVACPPSCLLFSISAESLHSNLSSELMSPPRLSPLGLTHKFGLERRSAKSTTAATSCGCCCRTQASKKECEPKLSLVPE